MACRHRRQNKFVNHEALPRLCWYDKNCLKENPNGHRTSRRIAEPSANMFVESYPAESPGRTGIIYDIAKAGIQNELDEHQSGFQRIIQNG
jgi:hypothetical protein